jgi:hypothetical protein
VVEPAEDANGVVEFGDRVDHERVVVNLHTCAPAGGGTTPDAAYASG